MNRRRDYHRFFTGERYKYSDKRLVKITELSMFYFILKSSSIFQEIHIVLSTITSDEMKSLRELFKRWHPSAPVILRFYLGTLSLEDALSFGVMMSYLEHINALLCLDIDVLIDTVRDALETRGLMNHIEGTHRFERQFIGMMLQYGVGTRFRPNVIDLLEQNAPRLSVTGEDIIVCPRRDRSFHIVLTGAEPTPEPVPEAVPESIPVPAPEDVPEPVPEPVPALSEGFTFSSCFSCVMM